MGRSDVDAIWSIDDEGTLVVRAPEGASGAVLRMVERVDEDGRTITVAPWDERCEEIRAARIERGVRAEGSIENLFSGCNNLRTADVGALDTAAVTNMNTVFYTCSFEEIDLSGWDVSSVVSMDSMFESCEELKRVDLAGWNTSSVRNFSWLFSYCLELEELDLSHLDTSAATAMAGMFHGCTRLRRVGAAGWDTSRVEDFSWMFANCERLEEVRGIERWAISRTADTESMFHGCDPALARSLH